MDGENNVHIRGEDGQYNSYRAYQVMAAAQGAIDPASLGTLDKMEQKMFDRIKAEHDQGIDREYGMPNDI